MFSDHPRTNAYQLEEENENTKKTNQLFFFCLMKTIYKCEPNLFFYFACFFETLKKTMHWKTKKLIQLNLN
jgi:hypothetical protein